LRDVGRNTNQASETYPRKWNQRDPLVTSQDMDQLLKQELAAADLDY
jgi:hypothetical protein